MSEAPKIDLGREAFIMVGGTTAIAGFGAMMLPVEVSPVTTENAPRYAQACIAEDIYGSGRETIRIDQAWLKSCVQQKHEKHFAQASAERRGTGAFVGFNGLFMLGLGFSKPRPSGNEPPRPEI